MASENEASCESDPNFAVICGFLEKFGLSCGLTNIDFLDLQEMLENTQEVSQDLVELHIKLLRKARKSVSNERWERALINLCHSYCSQDAWELERFGYKKARIGSKLRILKQLLEIQFDFNQKFKNEVNKMSAEELRSQPIGKDRMGRAYWCQCDESCQIRVYKDDPDEETWSLVAKDREGLVSLISQLGGSMDSTKSSSEPVSNEDSNSVEVEKPVLDTGQESNQSESPKLVKEQENDETQTENVINKSQKEEADQNDQVAQITKELSTETKTEGFSAESGREYLPGETESEDFSAKTERDKCSKAAREERETDKDKSPDKNDERCNQIDQDLDADTEETPDSNGSEETLEEEQEEEVGEEEDEEDDEDEEEEDEKDITTSNDSVKLNSNIEEEEDDVLNLCSKDVRIDEAEDQLESDCNEGLDLTIKSASTLRIKPLMELMPQPLEHDRKDFVGIKGKYIRGDINEKITLLSPLIMQGKAVQSASFDAISYKRQLEEDDYEEPAQPKHARFDRPTLLGNKKIQQSYSDEEVEDEIEEPMMLVQGEGSGYNNECVNQKTEECPVVGQVIEESVMYFFGEGNGRDCETGNNESNNSKKHTDENISDKSKSITKPDDIQQKTKKIHYKLGTIIDSKTNKVTNRNFSRHSRWDVGKPIDGASKVVDIPSDISECITNIYAGRVKDMVNKLENKQSPELAEKPNEVFSSDSACTSSSSKQSFFFGSLIRPSFGNTSTSAASLNFDLTKVCFKNDDLSDVSHKKHNDYASVDNVSQVDEIELKKMAGINVHYINKGTKVPEDVPIKNSDNNILKEENVQQNVNILMNSGSLIVSEHDIPLTSQVIKTESMVSVGDVVAVSCNISNDGKAETNGLLRKEILNLSDTPEESVDQDNKEIKRDYTTEENVDTSNFIQESHMRQVSKPIEEPEEQFKGEKEIGTEIDQTGTQKSFDKENIGNFGEDITPPKKLEQNIVNEESEKNFKIQDIANVNEISHSSDETTSKENNDNLQDIIKNELITSNNLQQKPSDNICQSKNILIDTSSHLEEQMEKNNDLEFVINSEVSVETSNKQTENSVDRKNTEIELISDTQTKMFDVTEESSRSSIDTKNTKCVEIIPVSQIEKDSTENGNSYGNECDNLTEKCTESDTDKNDSQIQTYDSQIQTYICNKGMEVQNTCNDSESGRIVKETQSTHVENYMRTDCHKENQTCKETDYKDQKLQSSNAEDTEHKSLENTRKFHEMDEIHIEKEQLTKVLEPTTVASDPLKELNNEKIDIVKSENGVYTSETSEDVDDNKLIDKDFIKNVNSESELNCNINVNDTNINIIANSRLDKEICVEQNEYLSLEFNKDVPHKIDSSKCVNLPEMKDAVLLVSEEPTAETSQMEKRCDELDIKNQIITVTYDSNTKEKESNTLNITQTTFVDVKERETNKDKSPYKNDKELCDQTNQDVDADTEETPDSDGSEETIKEKEAEVGEEEEEEGEVEDEEEEDEKNSIEDKICLDLQDKVNIEKQTEFQDEIFTKQNSEHVLEDKHSDIEENPILKEFKDSRSTLAAKVTVDVKMNEMKSDQLLSQIRNDESNGEDSTISIRKQEIDMQTLGIDTNIKCTEFILNDSKISCVEINSEDHKESHEQSEKNKLVLSKLESVSESVIDIDNQKSSNVNKGTCHKFDQGEVNFFEESSDRNLHLSDCSEQDAIDVNENSEQIDGTKSNIKQGIIENKESHELYKNEGATEKDFLNLSISESVEQGTSSEILNAKIDMSKDNITEMLNEEDINSNTESTKQITSCEIIKLSNLKKEHLQNNSAIDFTCDTDLAQSENQEPSKSIEEFNKSGNTLSDEKINLEFKSESNDTSKSVEETCVINLSKQKLDKEIKNVLTDLAQSENKEPSKSIEEFDKSGNTVLDEKINLEFKSENNDTSKSVEETCVINLSKQKLAKEIKNVLPIESLNIELTPETCKSLLQKDNLSVIKTKDLEIDKSHENESLDSSNLKIENLHKQDGNVVSYSSMNEAVNTGNANKSIANKLPEYSEVCKSSSEERSVFGNSENAQRKYDANPIKSQTVENITSYEKDNLNLSEGSEMSQHITEKSHAEQVVCKNNINNSKLVIEEMLLEENKQSIKQDNDVTKIDLIQNSINSPEFDEHKCKEKSINEQIVSLSSECTQEDSDHKINSESIQDTNLSKNHVDSIESNSDNILEVSCSENDSNIIEQSRNKNSEIETLDEPRNLRPNTRQKKMISNLTTETTSHKKNETKSEYKDMSKKKVASSLIVSEYEKKNISNIKSTKKNDKQVCETKNIESIPNEDLKSQSSDNCEHNFEAYDKDNENADTKQNSDNSLKIENESDEMETLLIEDSNSSSYGGHQDGFEDVIVLEDDSKDSEVNTFTKTEEYISDKKLNRNMNVMVKLERYDASVDNMMEFKKDRVTRSLRGRKVKQEAPAQPFVKKYKSIKTEEKTLQPTKANEDSLLEIASIQIIKNAEYRPKSNQKPFQEKKSKFTSPVRRSLRRRTTGDEADTSPEIIKKKLGRPKGSMNKNIKGLREVDGLKKGALLTDELRHSKRLKLSDNQKLNPVNMTMKKICNNHKNMKNKLDDVETIDLTSESEAKALSFSPPPEPLPVRRMSTRNTRQNTFQETDCKEGVFIEGVLIKGDVTIKIKEKVPVEEPECVKKNIPLLTCVDIEKLKEPSINTSLETYNEMELKSPMSSPLSVESSGGDIDNNSDVVIVEDDPLACSGFESGEIDMPIVREPLTLNAFKLDGLDSPLPSITTRSLRKRARVEADSESEQVPDNCGGKRRKTKGKRQLDLELRKSIEEQKKQEVSSSEDDNIRNNVQLPKFSPKRKSSSSSKPLIPKSSISDIVDSPLLISDAPSEISKNDDPPAIKVSTRKRKKKTIMGLDISPEIEEAMNDSISNVRQSRRIAQLKIKEEAERRKLEEIALNETNKEKKRKGKKNIDKDYKAEKRKKSIHVLTDDEVAAVDIPEPEEKIKRKKKRRKHKDPRKIFDESNPWRSSSDSSSSNDDVEEEEEIAEFSEAESPLFKSDHEFSPESDLEGTDEVQPLKRARTARKEDDIEEDVDDHACQKCGKTDHPEWILLCDGCDNGWHCSCLRPALLVIPEGDWHCPPCQHNSLLKKLEEKLVEYDKKFVKRENEVRRKERLAYVGISLANVLPLKDLDDQKQRKQKNNEEDSKSEESTSSSSSSSSSETDSDDEPIYQLRQRRQAHSYRFNDYDDLINSAIQDEMEAVKGAGNQGRGKDILTIVNAEKEEETKRNEEHAVEPLPPVVPVESKEQPPAVVPFNPDESEDEKIRPVKKFHGRKKQRKLNCLDVSSGDDQESDEDFKGSSTDDEEEEYEEDLGSDSSENFRRRKKDGPIRRSTRARISRYDKEFINDDSDDDEAPRRKKTKSVWDESESEESDRSWGRAGKRKTNARRKPSFPKKKKKKSKKNNSDSDDERYKKKKPRIKYGGLTDDDDDEEIGRRTRGKKINYIDALASDSEEDVRKRPPPRIESDDDYVANEDQDLPEDDDVDSEEKRVDETTSKLQDNEIASNLETTGTSEIAPEASNLENAEKELPLDKETLQRMHDLELLNSSLEKAAEELQSLPDFDDDESELNPIEEINKNLEQMNEKEMEMMMEEEEYANRQLHLMALQLEKERKRKERESKRLERLMNQEQRIPKKRGRKPKAALLSPEAINSKNIVQIATLQVGPDMQSNPELSEPPGVTIPLFSEMQPTTVNPDGTPRKRRGRGKGRKTLEKEAAAAAAFGPKDSMDSSNSEHMPSASNSDSMASNSPMHGGKLTIAAPPQPFSQTQPTPSVITRMLQSQSGQSNFPINMGHKYFADQPPPLSDGLPGPPPSGSPISGVPIQGPPSSVPQQFMHGGQHSIIPPPYRQSPSGMSPYPLLRGSTGPVHRLRPPGSQGMPPGSQVLPSGPQGMPPGQPGLPPGMPPSQGMPPCQQGMSPGQQMYHSHHPLDPSPSGGGPISVPNAAVNLTDQNSPPPTSESPLSNKSDQTPPPPSYNRPQMQRFPPSSPHMGASPIRHILPPQHMQQTRTNMPYHPGMPPNYFSGYLPPNIGTEESLHPTNYQYNEQFSEGNSPQDIGKAYEEENSGEFGGLVSYFSSQREDDLDT